jgi:predicted DNA-binding transcriptional regulator AlpA
MSGRVLITIDEFMRRLGVRGRSTFLQYERTMPGFPRRVHLTPAQPRFLEDEVDAFIESLARPAA